MKKILLILLTLSFSFYLNASIINGSGTGKTEKEAKDIALTNLSEQISVEVNSTFSKTESVSGNEYESEKQSSLDLKSHNLLLGVQITTFKLGNGYRAEALLTDTSIPLYEQDMENLKKEIYNIFDSYFEEKDVINQQKILYNAMVKYKKYESYRMIAVLLGSETKYEINLTMADLEKELSKVDKIINAPKIIYVKIKGNITYQNQTLLRTEIEDKISEIAKANKNKISLSKDFDSKVNTLITLELVSSSTKENPPVYYKNKKISGEFYVSNLRLNLEVYSIKAKSVLGTMVLKGEAKDFNSKDNSFHSAMQNAMKDSKAELSKIILNK